MELLAWIERSAFSTWLTEAPWPLFTLLIFHTIAMGFLLGTGAAINLRILGVAPRVPLPLLPRLMPVIHLALIVVVLSGVLLVIAYPAKALTNPLFYFKLIVLTAAFLLTRGLARFYAEGGVEKYSAKLIAALCLLLWASGLTAGKLLEYTYKVLTAT